LIALFRLAATHQPVPEANSIPIRHDVAEAAFDAAACIGCGACVATCKNSSAALFTSAKITHLALLPQGRIETRRRARQMVLQMDKEGFGHCTNTEACQVECPQQISVLYIARMNWEYNRAVLKRSECGAGCNLAFIAIPKTIECDAHFPNL
jgi:succinate dehydrogenase / fumarate reductase iron-sulfur subunit